MEALRDQLDEATYKLDKICWPAHEHKLGRQVDRVRGILTALKTTAVRVRLQAHLKGKI